MMMSYIVAIIAALAGTFLVGFIWYGPLFGKKWAKYTHIKQNDKEMKANMWKYVAKNQIASLIGICALAYIIAMGKPQNMLQLFILIVLLWLAFTVPSVMSSTIWERKPFGLAMINMFGSLVGFLVAGIILMKLI